MKTIEEIENLADEKYLKKAEAINDPTLKGFIVSATKGGYVDGYTQCAEDMANILKKAIEFGYELRNNNKPINSGIDWVKEFNSLNKQD